MVSNHKKEAVYRFFGCIVLRRPFFISTSARDIFSISEIKEDDTSPALLVNQSKSFVHCNAENCGLSSWRMKYLTILLTLYQDKNWFMSLTDFKIQISLKWNLDEYYYINGDFFLFAECWIRFAMTCTDFSH